jgi:hypothetical protein
MIIATNDKDKDDNCVDDYGNVYSYVIYVFMSAVMNLRVP